MITIKEITPIKLSGLVSFEVKFPYNAQIVDLIKTSGYAVWHKKELFWEVPSTSLSYLLDNLTYYDDIDLTLLEEKVEEEEKLKPILEYKVKPFPHQQEGIEFGINHKNWLLLDAPGLGKTAQIIHIAEELKEQKNLQHCLIICGINSLKHNWEKEIKIHSDLDCIIIGETITKKGTIKSMSIADRVNQLSEDISQFFIIINIESIRDERVVDALLKRKDIEMCVVDEVHKIKASNSIQSNNLRLLDNYKYKIGLTGTLILNTPEDTFVPLSWLGVDHATATNFKGQYCIYKEGFGIVGYKNLELLKDEIDSCSLRRTKDTLSLPPKNIIYEYLELNDTHKKFYDDVKAGIKKECELVNLKPKNFRAMITRLRQATSCPNVLTTKDIPSTKILRAIDLVEEITAGGDKVVIMSSFKEPIYQLQDLLKEYKPLIGTGDMKDEEVSRNVDLFQQDNEHKVFLATISKCGTGITLNKARYMILIDSPWTEGLFTQTVDRIHRINNKEPVFIYDLVCLHTVDELVERLVNRKKAISDFIIDDIVDDEKILRKYIKDLTN